MGLWGGPDLTDPGRSCPLVYRYRPEALAQPAWPTSPGTTFGVITRLSASPQPPADSLYGTTLDGLRCDALPLEFDLGWWLPRFLAQWPEGSPASDRYIERTRGGTQLGLHQAVRGTVTQTVGN